MNKTAVFALLAATALTLWGAQALAQIQTTGDPDLDKRLKSTLDSLLLEVRCDVPQIQPKVANLRRTASPNPDQIVKAFLGDKDSLLGKDQVVSPIWGKGTRFKSGSVIRLRVEKEIKQTDKGVSTQEVSHTNLESLDKLEVVPAFLDAYRQGFLYTNNIPHKAVYATDVKVVSELKANVSYRNVYDEKAGSDAVKQMLRDTMGDPKASEGFRIATEDMIQKYGERLYSWRIHPEYLTSYSVFEWVGEGKNRQYKQTGTKQVAIKVNDVYVHVLLDGDKLLCGMEYFWDNGLKVEGQAKPALNAAEAVIKSREWMVKHFNKNPPQVVVKRITLGFVQDRKDPTLLVPAWIFGASYSAEDETGETGMGSKVVSVPVPFAVNALTGEVFDL
ncbi:hypothetical protein IT575_02220 [bacterium]|nr:hypothetical protein [bacterium]